MLKPVSGTKFLCVKSGLRTKSCTQSRTPRTSSFLMATRSRLMVKSSHCVEYPRITSVVNWNTWKTQLHESMRQLTGVEATSLLGYDTYFIQLPTSAKTSLSRTERQDVTYVRAAPRGRRLQLPLFLHKGLVLSPARLNFAPLGPTLLSSPSKSLLNSCKGATSSPPTIIAGQKQRKPCPMTERAATVERTQFTKSSRNRRASRRNFFANNGYRLCPTQPSHGYQQESLYHRLLGIENDWEQRTLPTVQQEAMRRLS